VAEVASLSLEVKFESAREATAALREMVPAAAAAERAAQRWGTSNSAAARATEDFSKRVQRTIRDLEFERQQLTRSAQAQQRYAILRRAGVAEASAEGRAIMASVAALQAQKAAIESNNASRQRAMLLANSGKGATGLPLMGGGLGGLAATAAGYVSARAVVEAADAYTRFTNQLKVAGVAGSNMDEVQSALFASAQKNGVEIEALGKLYSRASMAAGELGADQGKLLQFTDGVTAALRVQGGSSESASGALLQLSQALGSGIVRAEEFNSILEGAYPIAQAAARGIDGMGGSVARLRAAVADGRVTSQQFFAGLLKGFEETKRQAEGMSLTVAQASTNLETSWIKLIGQADKLLGISPTIASAIGGIGSLMETLAANTERANRALAGLPKDASFLEKLDAIFGGRYGHNTMGGLRLETPAEAAERRLESLKRELASGNPANEGRESEIQAEIDKYTKLAQVIPEPDPFNMPPVVVGAPRVGPSAATGKKGGSDPYAKAIESAREYVLTKKAETAAVGETVLVAARLRHEQELLNKATGDGKTLSEAQKAAVREMAGAMAEADNALATAKFMDDAKTKSADFIAAQEMEQQALFMSAEAADALRFSTEMLNEARRAGIELTPDQVDAIKQSADAMAAAKARTQQLGEMVGLGREVFKGFFSDMREGLMNGQTVWEAFGNAAMNALNRIAEKLIEMAAAQLFEAAFPGGGSAGGGLGGLIGSIFGGGGGVAAGSGFTFAHGAAFHHGNVVPFASGGMVTSPTMFPMSGGRRGVMGEAGPEAIMPLRRGPNGSLGVQMHGGAAANENTTVIVNQTVHVGEFVTTQQFASGMRNVKKSAEEGAQAALINRRKRGGLDDVFR
jgi:tape measure domain-containing protein